MKLQYRILLAQLPALLVILILLLWGGRTVSRLGVESQKIAFENYRSVLAANQMQESIARLDAAEVLRMSGGGQDAQARFVEPITLFESALRVEQANITEPGESEAAEKVQRAWTEYKTLSKLADASEETDPRQFYAEQIVPALKQVHHATDQILALNNDALLRKGEEAAASAVAARQAWLAWAALGLLSAVTLGTLVSGRLTVPLRALAQSAEQVGDGQLDIRLPHSRIQELNSLAEAFNAMAARLRLYRRANDSELARARESAQAAIESLADPVLVLTLRGELRAFNGAARRLLALDPGARRIDACDPRITAAVERAHAQVVEEGRAVSPVDFSGVVVIDHAEGEKALLPHATPINDAVTGELVGVTVLLQDVTRLRRLDELKGNLVQTVAHELRTPLTSLGMALHLALDERVSGTLSTKLGELLATAREDTLRLRNLVEDLLDLSRIQEGRIALRREIVSPLDILTQAREVSRPAADAAGIPIDIDALADATPLSVDPARMQLALTNLLANAIRHAPAGSTVRLRALGRKDAVRFEVDNDGPPVPVGQRERIFEAFVRGAEEGTGAGLGLYIAREVARAHGGAIGVTDADGRGARFWLEIPFLARG